MLSLKSNVSRRSIHRTEEPFHWRQAEHGRGRCRGYFIGATFPEGDDPTGKGGIETPLGDRIPGVLATNWIGSNAPRSIRTDGRLR